MADTTDDCASTLTRIEGDVVVVTFTGAIDVFAAASVRHTLAGLISAEHRHLVVDLERVTFMDSTGVGVLIGAASGVRHRQGSVRLVCSPERSNGLFRITGLSKVIPVHETVELATAHLRAEFPATEECAGAPRGAPAGWNWLPQVLRSARRLLTSTHYSRPTRAGQVHRRPVAGACRCHAEGGR